MFLNISTKASSTLSTLFANGNNGTQELFGLKQTFISVLFLCPNEIWHSSKMSLQCEHFRVNIDTCHFFCTDWNFLENRRKNATKLELRICFLSLEFRRTNIKVSFSNINTNLEAVFTYFLPPQFHNIMHLKMEFSRLNERNFFYKIYIDERSYLKIKRCQIFLRDIPFYIPKWLVIDTVFKRKCSISHKNLSQKYCYILLLIVEFSFYLCLCSVSNRMYCISSVKFSLV